MNNTIDCMMCLAHIAQDAPYRESRSYICDGVTHAVSYGRRASVNTCLEAALTCTLVAKESRFGLGLYWTVYGATWVPL